MDDIAALLGLGISDEEQTRALADSLRGRKRAADFFALSTVGNIAKGAQAEREGVMQGAQRAGVLRNALAEREAAEQRQREQFAYQSEENLRRREFEDQMRQREEALRRELEGMRQQGKGSMSIKGITLVQDPEGKLHRIGYTDDGIPVNLATRQPLTEEQITTWEPYTPLTEAGELRALGALGEKTNDMNRLVSDIENLDDILESYDNQGIPFSEIPGFGFLEKQSNVLGGAVRLAQDAVREGSEQGSNFSAAKSVINTISRLRAGLSQTGVELKNIKDETGTDPLSGPGVFMEYYPRLKKAIEEDLALIRATTNPRVLGTYEQALPEGGRNILDHQFRRFTWDLDAEEARLQRMLNGANNANP